MALLYTIFWILEHIFFALCPERLAARYRAASFLVRMALDIYPAAEQGPDHEYLTKFSPAPPTISPGSQGLQVQREAPVQPHNRTDPPARAAPAPAPAPAVVLDTKVFLPPYRSITASTRTILAVHGFADSGYNDARMVSFARALSASSGAIVVVPNFQTLIECKMDDEAVASIRAAIDAVATDPALCPTHLVSLAAFCVCAGFTVLAAADAGSVVDAIMCVGAYADFKSLVDFCIQEEGKGDSSYGTYSAMSNYWRREDPVYRQIFLAELRDDHYRRKGQPDAELPKLLEMYPRQGADFKRLTTDPAFLEIEMRGAFSEHEEVSARLSLSPSKLKQLKSSSITLVHAAVDGIIPPSESMVVYDRLIQHTSIPVKLCITPLLNHGDKQQLNFWSTFDIMRLVDTFSLFFKK